MSLTASSELILAASVMKTYAPSSTKSLLGERHARRRPVMTATLPSSFSLPFSFHLCSVSERAAPLAASLLAAGRVIRDSGGRAHANQFAGNHLASFEARKVATLAMSSPWPMRPSGVCRHGPLLEVRTR